MVEVGGELKLEKWGIEESNWKEKGLEKKEFGEMRIAAGSRRRAS